MVMDASALCLCGGGSLSAAINTMAGSKVDGTSGDPARSEPLRNLRIRKLRDIR